MQNLIKIRLLLWSVLTGIVLWILYMGIVPGGRIVYMTDFKEPDYFIGRLTPADRLRYEGEKGESALMVGDPVYFSLRTPRRFDQALFTLKYRRKGYASSPLIEAGFLADKIVWRYDLEPLENRTLDQLLLAWDAIREDDIVFLQRKRVYGSLDEFLLSTTSPEKLAIYEYDPGKEYLLPEYEPDCEKDDLCHKIEVSWRGSYQFYTYIKNEELNFKFTLSDMNENKDSDPADILLYYEGALIASRHLDDDGRSADDGKASDDREMEIILDNLPEGAYKIEVRANSDVVTEKIESKQGKLAFINKIELADRNRKFINLWTDSRKIQATTANQESLQTIGVGHDELVIDATYKQFELVLNRPASSSLSAVFLDRDGLILSGDGVFALSEEAFFNPRIRKVDANIDINADGIDYVIARYRSPEIKGDWYEARVSFDLRRAYRENGSYGFIISVPGLRADDETDDALEIREIKVELRGGTLWEKVKRIFNVKNLIRK